MSIFPNQIPRSVDIIKKQLADLAKVIAVSDHNYRPDFASELFLASIDAHEVELKEELKAAEWLEKNCDVELFLSGQVVVEHSIQIDFLAQLMNIIHNLRTTTANIAIKESNNKTRLAKKLKNQNLLMVERFNPSSFAIQLSYMTSPKPSLLSDLNEERPGDSLFLSLLSDETRTIDYKIITSSPKLLNHYLQFLNLLIRNNVTIITRTKAHPFPTKITTQTAINRIKNIDNNIIHSDKEKIIEIDGILVMVDIKNNCFNIESNNKFFKGQVSEKVANELRVVNLGSKVKAQLLVKAKTKNLEQDNYELLSLSAINS
ncbi:MAG: hypothetical protein LBS60_15385 [Deltaproteobacteria bacterium]|jgi:acetolactate synthase small subunit|nr:hypothetical protein [Deltaproteobacteria bacterium]